MPPLRHTLPAALLLALAPAVRAQVVAERATDPDTGRTYLRSVPLSIHQARRLAREVGGTLACVESEAEETFLLDNFGAAEGYWLGLEYPRERWDSGAPMEFAHWATGHPRGPDEPFTVMNWLEPGAWGSHDGDAAGTIYRALIELPPGVEVSALPPPPRVGIPSRCVLLCAIEGLEERDVETSRHAALSGLWKASAHTLDAGADRGRDPLASLGMVLWGVGPAKSGLPDPARKRHGVLNVLTRLEMATEVSTAALLDDPKLVGILVDGRVDLRSSSASPRRGGATAPAEEALALPSPLVVAAAWTAPEEGERSSSARAKDVAAIDAELGRLLELVRARPTYADEEWMIVVTGLDAPEPRKKDDEVTRATAAVPLLVQAPGVAEGELLDEAVLTDLAPTVAAHLGVEPVRAWQLDGRALPLGAARAPGEELLANGGAEAQLVIGFGGAPLIAGWRQVLPFRVGRLDPDLPGPEERGTSCFEGSDAPLSRMEQTVDLRPLDELVSSGDAVYRLTGWLGARGRAAARIRCWMELLDERGKTVREVELGTVGQQELREALDPEGGAPATGLIPLTAEGPVPRRVKAARVILVAEGEGAERTMADELSLVIVRE